MPWASGFAISWMPRTSLRRRALCACAGSYGKRAGGLPDLDLESFTLGIGGYLNWTYNAFCEALLAEGSEKTAFAELSIREVLDDPLTVDKLTALLDSTRALA